MSKVFSLFWIFQKIQEKNYKILSEIVKIRCCGNRDNWILIFDATTQAMRKSKFQRIPHIWMDKWTCSRTIFYTIRRRGSEPWIFFRKQIKAKFSNSNSIWKKINPFAVNSCRKSSFANILPSTRPTSFTHPCINHTIVRIRTCSVMLGATIQSS